MTTPATPAPPNSVTAISQAPRTDTHITSSPTSFTRRPSRAVATSCAGPREAIDHFREARRGHREGMSDYYYLHALGAQCRASGREPLSDDVYVTPCGGTKLVGHIASLFLGQKVRPVVLLDGDDAGRARQSALIKELYAAHTTAILMLDDALGRAGAETEIEDILGEEILLPSVSAVLGQTQTVKLSAVDRAAGSLPGQIKAWAVRHNVKLPDGWKASAAIQLVSQWAEQAIRLPDEVLDRASVLFAAINDRFRQMR